MYKEFSVPNGNEYSKFGNPYPTEDIDKDPVSCCLPGSFLNCSKVANMGNCQDFMSERCSKNFDDKCELYANSLNDVNSFKNFLRKSMSKKFCSLDPKSKCGIKCEPMFPIERQSPVYCNVVGKEAILDSAQTVDIGLSKSVNVSGVYMGNCLHNCNKIDVNAIPDNDSLINTCVKYGMCKDILSNMCEQSKGDSYNNKVLEKYCKLYKDQNVQTFSNKKGDKQRDGLKLASSFKSSDESKQSTAESRAESTSQSTPQSTDNLNNEMNYNSPDNNYNGSNKKKTTIYDYLLFFIFLVLFFTLIYYLYVYVMVKNKDTVSSPTKKVQYKKSFKKIEV